MCLGGSIAYEHDRWINNHIVSSLAHSQPAELSKVPLKLNLFIGDQSIDCRMHLQRFEEFKKLHDRATNDLENLHLLLLDKKSIRADETEQALRTCAHLNGDVRTSLDATLTNGKPSCTVALSVEQVTKP